jgi:hypothetical protein
VTFRSDGILAVLEDGAVRCVLTGGLAATIPGASTVTFDESSSSHTMAPQPIAFKRTGDRFIRSE